MIQEYMCPNCGSLNVKQADNLIYASNPPQIKLRCMDCGSDFMSGVHTPKETQNTINNNPPSDTQIPRYTTDKQAPYMSYQQNGFTAKNSTNNANMFLCPQGWICPKCGNVMSPNQPYCLFCCSEVYK